MLVRQRESHSVPFPVQVWGCSSDRSIDRCSWKALQSAPPRFASVKLPKELCSPVLFMMDALLAFSYSHERCSCVCYQLFTLARFSISHCHQLQPPAVVPAGCSCCAALLSSVQPAKLLTASVSAQPFLSASRTVFQLCLRSSGDTQGLQQANFPEGSHPCFETHKQTNKTRQNTKRCFAPDLLLVPLL